MFWIAIIKNDDFIVNVINIKHLFAFYIYNVYNSQMSIYPFAYAPWTHKFICIPIIINIALYFFE